ncbi:hypothetical protein Q2379_26410 [Escherichia coli]|nr:hypothetical protein [Escherichia coli]
MENNLHIIDAAINVKATSQTFREYRKNLPPENPTPPTLTVEHVPLNIRRLEYYRLL